MASFETSTEKATDKATKGTTTVTSTAVADPDFTVGQTYHAFAKGETRAEVDLHSGNDDRPTYCVKDSKTTFFSSSDLTIYRETRYGGPVVANIRLPSSRSGSDSAAIITYPGLEEAAYIPVTAVKEILSSQQSVRICGRDYVWQGEKRENHPGLPIQNLRDEHGDIRAKFVWDPRGWDSKARPGAFGRLLLVDTATEQDVLDQIVATAMVRVFQQIKREERNHIGGYGAAFLVL